MYIGRHLSVNHRFFSRFYNYTKCMDGFVLDLFWITIIYSSVGFSGTKKGKIT